jgi:cation-transporting ATPase 13A2
LIFLGLLVLENKLKEDSAENILVLKNACINCKIISGDNVLTTVKCAKDANVLNLNDNILVCNSFVDCFFLNNPS